MFTICGAMKHVKVTSKGKQIEGYILYYLTKDDRPSLIGVATGSTFVTTEQYISFKVESLINAKTEVDIRYNKYGYVERITSAS